MRESALTKPVVLKGRRVLIVEDDYMIAQAIVEMLSTAGAQTLGPVPNVDNALRLIAAEKRIDCALLDVNLGGKAIWPVVDLLQTQGVPLVLATGYDVSAIPQEYAYLPRCEKPASEQDLAHALAQVLAKALLQFAGADSHQAVIE